jgi:hypothetical protein
VSCLVCHNGYISKTLLIALLNTAQLTYHTNYLQAIERKEVICSAGLDECLSISLTEVLECLLNCLDA